MTPVTKQKKKRPFLASDEKIAHKNENPTSIGKGKPHKLKRKKVETFTAVVDNDKEI